MTGWNDVDNLMGCVLGSDKEAVRELIYSGQSKGSWRVFISSLLEGVEVPEEVKVCFHTVWTELGGRIRNQVGDDRILAEMLRALLPKYQGENVELYRGENSERYKGGQIGFCWTPRIERAKMFAQGLNAYHGDGGVLLSTMANRSAIIAGPSAHSIYLGEYEYTLNPFFLGGIEVVKTYPSLSFDR